MADLNNAAQQIGFMLAGGGKQMREQAFDEGRLNTAKTEEALAGARDKRLQAQARATKIREAEKFEEHYIATGGDPKKAALIGNLIRAEAGSDFYASQQGLGERQDQGFRETLASMDSTPEERLRAGFGVQGKVSPDIAPVGTHGVVDLTQEDQELLRSPGSGTTAMRNFEYSQDLPPEQREQFSPFVRADQILQVGGVPTPRAATTGTTKPAVSAEETAANAAEIERQKRVAREQATAQTSLRDAMADIDKMTESVNSLLQEPGFDTIYGLSSQLDPRVYLRGTDASNAIAKLQNIDAQAFGVSIQKMRGLGQLSNAEGKRVTDAFTAATNPAMSSEAARQAWGVVLFHLNLARQRSIEKAFNPDPSGATAPGSFGVSAPGAEGTEEGPSIEEIIVNEGLGEYNDAGDLVDGRGWVLMKDAQGNAAWVSPDGAQFEEVAQ